MAALEQWPASGIPDRPGAWLMTVAKRRAVDEIRRDVTLAGKVELLGPRAARGRRLRAAPSPSRTTSCG